MYSKLEVTNQYSLSPNPDSKRTLVMGILNVTPDSFSDGGRWDTPEAAIARGQELIAQGADLLDIGGESTRPGSQRLAPAQEQERVLAVIKALSPLGVPISIDTMNSATAWEAVAAGARIINDVSGGQADPEMARIAAESQAQVICQHWEGGPHTMEPPTQEPDILARVQAGLSIQVEQFLAAGCPASKIIVDPGLGFAKTPAQCWSLLHQLDTLAADGFPVLVGASRKRFLASAMSANEWNSLTARDHATAAISALAATAGAWAVRVHEIPANLYAVRVASAWRYSP